MPEIKSINIKIIGNATGLYSSLDKAKKAVSDFRKDITTTLREGISGGFDTSNLNIGDSLTKSLSDSVLGVGKNVPGLVGVAATAVEGFTNSLQKNLEKNREVMAEFEAAGERGKKFGLSSLGAGAVESRGDAGKQMFGSIIKLIGDVESGSDDARKKLEDIGIPLTDVIGRTGEQVFMSLAKRISETKGSAQQLATSMKLFGEQGADFLPMLQRGGGQWLGGEKANQFSKLYDKSWTDTLVETISGRDPSIDRGKSLSNLAYAQERLNEALAQQRAKANEILTKEKEQADARQQYYDDYAAELNKFDSLKNSVQISPIDAFNKSLEQAQAAKRIGAIDETGFNQIVAKSFSSLESNTPREASNLASRFEEGSAAAANFINKANDEANRGRLSADPAERVGEVMKAAERLQQKQLDEQKRTTAAILGVGLKVAKF